LLADGNESDFPREITKFGTSISRSGFRQSVFLYCGEIPAPNKGLGASASEHSPKGCVSQEPGADQQQRRLISFSPKLSLEISAALLS